jgi:hypothetical protein
MTQAPYMLDTEVYKRTRRIRNTYCFSTTLHERDTMLRYTYNTCLIIKMKWNRSLNTTNGLLAKMESSYVTTCFGLHLWPSSGYNLVALRVYTRLIVYTVGGMRAFDKFWALHLLINPLQTKRRLLYLKTQFVPRSKHFSSRI